MTGLQVDIVVPVRNEERDLAPSVRRLVGYARARLRPAAVANSPATCANISLNGSIHAACPASARSRTSSTKPSMTQAWPARTPKSRSHAAPDLRQRL
jgi:hypothetical protein